MSRSQLSKILQCDGEVGFSREPGFLFSNQVLVHIVQQIQRSIALGFSKSDFLLQVSIFEVGEFKQGLGFSPAANLRLERLSWALVSANSFSRDSVNALVFPLMPLLPPDALTAMFHCHVHSCHPSPSQGIRRRIGVGQRGADSARCHDSGFLNFF